MKKVVDAVWEGFILAVMDDTERLWRWFCRVHELKTGVKLTEASKDYIWIRCFFDYWLSGYQCRVLDEEADRVKEGALP